jgi:hypothetical protein
MTWVLPALIQDSLAKAGIARELIDRKDLIQ